METKSGKIIVEIDEEMEDLIPGYLKTRQQELLTLQKAIQSSDVYTIRMIGHTLKGSGGGYGFDRLTELGALLESSARESNLAEAQTHLDCLLDYLARVEVRYIEESGHEA